MPVFTPNQKTWTQSGPGAGNARRYELDYDPAEQLTGAVLRNMTDNVILKGYGYRYDEAGNRAGTQVSTPQGDGSSAVVLTTDTSNTVNQLVSRAGGSGKMTFEGTVDEPAKVTVGGQAAQVWKNGDNTFGFRATAALAAGVNSVEIKATDASNNTNTKHTSVTVAGAGIPVLSYDANGNTLNDGTRNYVWDAANQMVAIIYGAEAAGNRTEFTYDGAGRRVRMVEYESGNATSTRRFVWAGLSLVEERDAANLPVKRYYAQGFQTLNTQPSSLNTFYSRDHLGSIRQHISATGTVLASYNYDPYGNLEVTTGPAPDFAYTGHLYHARSGLHLAPFREYSAELGRWLSRDPIEEEGGLNLYGYVTNDPINLADPDGKHPLILAGAVLVGVFAIIGIVASCSATKKMQKKTKDAPRNRSDEFEDIADGKRAPTTMYGDATKQAINDVKEGASDVAGNLPGQFFTGPADSPTRAEELIPPLVNEAEKRMNQPREPKADEKCPPKQK